MCNRLAARITELSYVVAWDTRLGCAHSKTSHDRTENRKIEILRLSLIARRQQLTAGSIFLKYGDRSGNQWRRIKIQRKDDDRGRNVWCSGGRYSVADCRVVERAKKIREKSVVDRNRQQRWQRNEPHTFVASVGAHAYLTGPRVHRYDVMNIMIIIINNNSSSINSNISGSDAEKNNSFSLKTILF